MLSRVISTDGEKLAYDQPYYPPGPGPGPQPPQSPQPPQYTAPVREPAPTPFPQPPRSEFPVKEKKKQRSLMNSKLVFFMVLSGLIVFHIGLIIMSSMILVESPESEDYENDYEAYENARDDYQDTMRNMLGSGRICIVIGGLIESLALIGSGVGNTDQDIKIRAISISAGIAFVIAVLVVLNIFSSFIPY